MADRIEDYALVGDTRTAGLVGDDGSVDWLCLPRFDSDACFASLLGGPEHGRWLLAPAIPPRRVSRRYRDDALVLETTFDTDTGTATVIDCMPRGGSSPGLIRLVQGRRGRVPFRMDLAVRFDYGLTVPWVHEIDGRTHLIAGPNGLCLDTPAVVHGKEERTIAAFEVDAGDTVPFTLLWHPSHLPPPAPIDAAAAVEDTERWWRAWASACTYTGPWQDAVARSLLVLKAQTYAATGGIIAAPTTSLPEQVGGPRNWDYRYCWPRDAAFTLVALLQTGYREEARAWRDWLVRAVAGKPSQLQVLYGVEGERRLPEAELPGLPGYQGSAPVRIGNDAAAQFQLDVYGEVIDALQQAHAGGLEPNELALGIREALVEFLEEAWRLPDEGIWEVRGPPRHFTHSKVMSWVAADRAARAARALDPGDGWRRWGALRDQIHEDVCRNGVDERGVFVQSYASTDVDAALLMVPLVGFLPASDHRVIATVEAVERELMVDGFVYRYRTETDVDGLPAGEGAFLMCSFWLADCLVLLGRHADADRLFRRLLDVRNDLGLLSEQYDPSAGRLLGNFPQAISHVSLINTAVRLAGSDAVPPD